MKRAKVLVNTSIHEALPVSFLEAFSYGVTVVSNQDPDQLVSKFGVYIGQSYGDGWGDVDKFITAINGVMSNELRRVEVAKKAKEYVDKVHGVENFRIIFNELTK